MEGASQIRVVSSMATKRLLEELTGRFESTSPLRIALESTGGVDAAKRVRAGEAFDIIVLAGDVIDALTSEGRIVEGSRADVVKSPVAIAVRAGAPRPDVRSAEAVKRAVLDAASIGYSTGPSGTYLGTLFAKWGIADAVKDRIVIAPPGVPVASLVAKGDVALGFQQLSELIAAEGIDVIGLLPDEIQFVTTFSGGIAHASAHPDDARQVLEFFAAPHTAEVKRRHGMEQP
ncbi:MAG TPA: substrate-binding domain-containing protein [Vicinamibacterales bacterium]|nr:substrate-binding domain-containing protein [Vicinamibacterales bacterium]